MSQPRDAHGRFVSTDDQQDQELTASASESGQTLSTEDLALRAALAQSMGQTRPGNTDTYDVFNYDTDPGIDEFYASFLRSRYGGPVVEIPPNTSWRDAPDISDDKETDSETQFEKDLAALVDKRRLWNYGNRADVLAGIGEYGLLVLEFSDITAPSGFNKPVESADSLTGLRPFSLKSVEEIKVGGPGSGRWGEPVRYKLDLEDEDDDVATIVPGDDGGGQGGQGSGQGGSQSGQGGGSVGPDEMWVHHSRVIHIPSDGLLDDEIRGQPRQEGVWNTLTDIEKTMGSAAELAYRASAWGLAVNIAKDFDLTDGGDELRENLQRWYHGLEPVLRTQGAESIQNLGGEDIDPSLITDPNLEVLAAQTGIPQKVLRGNESGEVAGSQDLESFYGMIQERREQFVSPVIVRPLVQRCIDVGVLAAPSGGNFSIEWSPLAEMSEQQESEIQLNRSKAAKNLAKAVPAYSGEEWVEYVESGEFPEVPETDDMPVPSASTMDQRMLLDDGESAAETATARQPALPDGAGTGFRTVIADSWNPELHPRNPETGQFIETPGGEIPDSASNLVSALPDEYDGEVATRREIRDVVAEMAQTGASYQEVVSAVENNMGGLDTKTRRTIATQAYINQQLSANIGGESVETGPILRDAFNRDKTEFRQAAESELAETVADGEYSMEFIADIFGGWASASAETMLNQDTYPLWGVVASETGNRNEPPGAGASIPRDVPDEERQDIMDLRNLTVSALRETFGDTIPVARGFHGEMADAIKDAKENGESVELDHRTLESWSTFFDTARDFARLEDGEGVILYRELPVESVWASSFTTPELLESENEIIAADEGPVEYAPENIYTSDDEGMIQLYDRAGMKSL